jgi:hypothetical protein
MYNIKRIQYIVNTVYFHTEVIYLLPYEIFFLNLIFSIYDGSISSGFIYIFQIVFSLLKSYLYF